MPPKSTRRTKEEIEKDDAKDLKSAKKILRLHLQLAHNWLAYKIEGIREIETLLRSSMAGYYSSSSSSNEEMLNDLRRRRDEVAVLAGQVYSAREVLKLEEISMQTLMTKHPFRALVDLDSKHNPPPMSPEQREAFRLWRRTVRHARGKFDPEGDISVPLYAEDGDDEDIQEPAEDGNVIGERWSAGSSPAKEEEEEEGDEERGEELDVEWDEKAFLSGNAAAVSPAQSPPPSPPPSPRSAPAPRTLHASRYMQVDPERARRQEERRKMRGRGLVKSLTKAAGVHGLDNHFPGEMHAPLRVKGKTVIANFMGPGTQVKARLERGDVPVSDMDKISLAHDLRYMLATSKADIQEADRLFLAKARSSTDNLYNRGLGLSAIGAKYAAEKLTGVLYPTQAELNANDVNDSLLTSHMSSLSQDGYGSHFA
jgi:hypothetical protein